MLDVLSPIGGNSYVVEMLEKCLAEAKKGKVSHACVILATGPGNVSARFAGLSGMEITANYGCDLLKKELMEITQKRMLAPNNPDAPVNRIFYDLFKMPVSFDFAAALLKAEMARKRQGIEEPLRVAWYLGPNNNIAEALNTPQREQYFYGIMRPLVRLIGGIEDETAIDGQEAVDCSFAPVVQSYLAGESLPKFTAPPAYCEGITEFLREAGAPAPVTITLREADHSIHRNSNLPEWIKLANWLKEQGESVIFLRDTAKSREELPEHCTCYAASENLLVRAALYAQAKANLFVSNGPGILAIFGDRPWLMFNELQDDHWYRAGTSEGWKHFTGLEPGGQWPWSRNDQRIIWHRDTFEVMRDAWRAHIAPTLAKAAA